MNQITNKALLWNKCVDQGIFNNVNKSDAPRIQPLFESTLDSFNNRFEDLEILNNEFIIKLPCYNLDDKDGKYIYKYIEKNNMINEYTELYRLSKLYNNWFFYYGEAIDIYSQESL